MARSAARLRRIVGPLATPKAGAGRSRQRDIIGHRPGITEHIPNIFRTYSGIVEHEKFAACGSAGRRIACRQSRRVPYRLSPDRVPYGPLRRDSPSPDRVPSISSRAVSPVAGHGGGDGRHVRYRPSPDRVPYRPSLNDVSSCAVLSVAGSRLVPSRPPSAISCLCDAHGRVRRRPVVCHAPAQHGL